MWVRMDEVEGKGLEVSVEAVDHSLLRFDRSSQDGGHDERVLYVEYITRHASPQIHRRMIMRASRTGGVPHHLA